MKVDEDKEGCDHVANTFVVDPTRKHEYPLSCLLD